MVNAQKAYTPEAPTPSLGLCTDFKSGSHQEQCLTVPGESKLEEALAEVSPVETDSVPMAAECRIHFPFMITAASPSQPWTLGKRYGVRLMSAQIPSSV